jgi:ABC-2 type transport system ATP-binding protein
VVRIESIADLLNQSTELRLRVDSLTPELRQGLERLGTQLQIEESTVSMLVSNEELIPEIAHLVHNSGAKLYELSPRQKSLEEIFVDIIAGGRQ